MRKYFGYTVIVVALVTLVVWAISAFIQPTLSSTVNSGLILFFVAFLAVAGALANMKDIAELLRSLVERKRPVKSVVSTSLDKGFTQPPANKTLRQSLSMRLEFLDGIDEISNADELDKSMTDLVKFIERLNQGPYFAQKITELAHRPRRLVWSTGEDDDVEARETEEYNRQYRAQLVSVRDDIRRLVDELIGLQ